MFMSLPYLFLVCVRDPHNILAIIVLQDAEDAYSSSPGRYNSTHTENHT
jgi:hypothetical protein